MLNYNKYRYTSKAKLTKSIKLNIFRLSRFISSHLLITLILITIFILSAYTTVLVYNHYKNISNINNTNINTNIDSVILVTYDKKIEVTTTSPILPRKTIEVSRGNTRVKNVNTSIVEPVVIDKVDKVIEDKKVDVKVDKDKINFEYIDSFQGNITMYTLDPSECSKFPWQKGYGIGASGIRVSEGVSVAMGKQIPFHTKVRIEGIDNVYINQDSGNGVGRTGVDIFTNNKKEALRFGRQFRKVYILSYGKKSK